MTTVPIVTEVTKAQLDALVAANGLNEGLQYKVTDTQWLLIATSDNTLKSSTGEILTTNAIGLPEYIETDVLLVDTGIINNDIDTVSGTPISLNVDMSKYIAQSGLAKVITCDDVCSKIQLTDYYLNLAVLSSNMQTDFNVGSIVPMALDCDKYPEYSEIHPYKICATGVGSNNTTIRILIIFKRIPYML